MGSMQATGFDSVQSVTTQAIERVARSPVGLQFELMHGRDHLLPSISMERVTS
jgi:hypothetical protein